MRIIHTSDWHLGQYFYGKSRANEHKQFLNWLIAQVEQHQVDAIIVAGDIFDTGSPPSYARELYFDFISQLQQLSTACQLIVLAGNHDSPLMIGESKQLLTKLSTHVIPSAAIVPEEQVFPVLNKNGDIGAIICAVPFIRPRDVLQSSAGLSAVNKQQQLQQAIAEHYQTLYQQALILAGGSEDKKYPIIATGHLTTVGATTSDSVRDIYIGTLDAFPASAFPPADYIALGHIHQMQNVAKSKHIRYCGSPIPLSFDECKQDKKVLLVDVLADQPPVIEPLIIPCFQPMAVVKTSVENVVEDIELLLADLQATSTLTNASLWLDIEINSVEYRSDIQMNIIESLQEFIDTKQIEILLIRRSKSQRQERLIEQENITLEELTPLDVFNERLAQVKWSGDEAEIKAKKARLTVTFQQTLASLHDQAAEPEQFTDEAIAQEASVNETGAKQNEQGL